jgi:gluconate 2-dehydrogenase subunit 3-like protein
MLLSAASDEGIMGEKVELPVVSGGPKTLGRREVLQGLVGVAGAGLALPAVAQDHPVRGHLANHERVAKADAVASTPGAKPAFLDAHQMETLISLAERIVPGSTRARVAPFVDQLLAVDTHENQRKFLGALGWIDGQASARFQHPWKALTPAQQTELLTAVSTTEPARPPHFWVRGEAVIVPPPLPDLPPTTRDRFDELKGWIAGAYYSSEIGMRELGWTGQTFFASFPGCEHPGGHR